MSSSSGAVKTAVIMMNLGGPQSTKDVYPFLLRLFSDRELIQLPFQRFSAPLIARRRTPSIEKQYSAIGGGSPILKWTQIQGKLMIEGLDRKYPETAPHKSFIAFRYAPPLTRDCVVSMMDEGVTRAVAFSQYPQYSCATTGSSINHLHHILKSVDPHKTIQWSFIDRWPTHSKLIQTFALLIREKLALYPVEERSKVVLLFSAHSLPMSVVNRGDPYPQEVSATVQAIMEKLSLSNPYRLVWQSQVGPSAWLGLSTNEALQGLAKRGCKNVILVPVAFTSDHVETLYELDLEYMEEAKKLGMTGVRRCDSLNDHPLFIETLVDLVGEHMKNNRVSSNQLQLQCPKCVNPKCLESRQFFLNI